MHILMIVGSLRTNSYNRQLAEHIEEIIGDRAKVSYLRFDDVPLMNQDIEFPAPATVERCRREISAADGIWIVSPEYNHSIPGSLKNLLDWMSRPILPEVKETVLRNKPVTFSGAAGKSASADVRSALETLAVCIRMDVIGGIGTGVSIDFMKEALILSETTEAALHAQANTFIERCSR